MNPYTDINNYYTCADGTKVYFTTNRQLVDSDRDGTGFLSACVFPFPLPLEGCDVYLYDSTLPQGERLIQVSAGEDNAQHESGVGAKVLNGTTAISGDGSRVYFVAEGVLTEHPNPEGATALAGAPNLYLWDEATKSTAFIGTLYSGDKTGLWAGEGKRSSGGQRFDRGSALFMSAVSNQGIILIRYRSLQICRSATAKSKTKFGT